MHIHVHVHMNPRHRQTKSERQVFTYLYTLCCVKFSSLLLQSESINGNTGYCIRSLNVRPASLFSSMRYSKLVISPCCQLKIVRLNIAMCIIICTWKDKQIDRYIDKKIDRQVDKQMVLQIDRQIDRYMQIGKQINKL